MADLPWFKFYASDWRSDPRLRMCSMAARGLWIEMIALMHEATPYGHLLVSGHSPTDAQLAVLAGAPSDQVSDLLGELDAAGVFSRTKEGTIYSRKMTRMQKKAATARKNGRRGGNPSLGKHEGNPASDKPPDKGRDKAQSPEARGQSPEDDTANAASSMRAGARDPDRKPERSSFLDLVRDAANAPETSTWSTDPFLSPIIERWRQLGLSEPEMLDVIRATAKGRHISSPSYFDGAMAEAAGRKNAPSLVPIPPSGSRHRERPQRDEDYGSRAIIRRARASGELPPRENNG